MPRYMDIAAEANITAKSLLDLVPAERKEAAAQAIARLVNYGLRCAPRAVQSTVRLNAVRRACQGLPVTVGLIKKTDPKTGKTYNVLTTSGQEADSSADDDT